MNKRHGEADAGESGRAGQMLPLHPRRQARPSQTNRNPTEQIDPNGVPGLCWKIRLFRGGSSTTAIPNIMLECTLTYRLAPLRRANMDGQK